MVYPLAHAGAIETIKAAVALAASLIKPGDKLSREDHHEFTRFLICFGPTVTQASIIRVEELIANVRIDVVGALVPAAFATKHEPAGHHDVIAGASFIMQVIDERVEDLLRKGVSLNDLKPPPPSINNMWAVFNWQRIYYPEMSEEELAAAVHLSPQTIRNERSRLKFGKRLIKEIMSLEEMRKKYPIPWL
jgi:hypothetical protein